MSNLQLSQASQATQEEWLARMVLSSRVLWHLWHQAPNQPILDELEVFLDEWPLGREQDDVQAGLARMRAGRVEDFSALSTDYADLFVGPDTLKAAPWGSVYLHEEQITFDATMMDVRAFYSQHGLEVATGEHEPDDHIGLMFAFIAWLGEARLEQDDNSTALLSNCFDSIAILLSNHMLTWAPRLCQLVEDQAATQFYRGLAQVTAGTIAAMADLVGAVARPARLYR